MIKKFLYVGLIGLLTGCSDFLEPKSQSEFIPKDIVSLNEMLLGVAYPQGTGGGKEIMSIMPLFEDDICCTDSLGTVGLNQMTSSKIINALFSWQPDAFKVMYDNGSYVNEWRNYYEFIVGANAALDYLDDVSGSKDEKNLVKGQACALRAFYYFQLVNLWGEPYNYNKKALGVPLKTTSALEYKELPRNTVEEVYEQIMRDLNDAEKCYEALPENLQFKKDYRVSLPMIQLLKSRVFLYMENWTEAAIYAKKVIEDWEFALLDFNSLPAPTLDKPYYNFITMDSPECIWVFGEIKKDIGFIDEIVERADPYDPSKMISVCKLNAAPELLEAYMEGDLRKENYIVRNLLQNSRGKYSLGGYCAFGKFAISSLHSADNENGFAHAFRVAEAYLNLAEAAAKDNDETTALWALNELRMKRFTPEFYKEVSGISGEELVDRIRLERRLEMCFEGHRWFDLRRYGMPSFTRAWKDNGQVVKYYTLEKNDPFYTLPIPYEVMQENRNLVQNELPNPR